MEDTFSFFLYVLTAVFICFIPKEQDPCSPFSDNIRWVCDTPVGLKFKDQHVTGCHGAKYVILDNVTSDSLTLYVADTVYITNMVVDFPLNIIKPCN